MNQTLDQLIAERETLDQRIKEIQGKARSEAISKVLAIIADHDLTEQDLFTSRSSTKAGKVGTKKVAAKYRDSEGNEWSGRGIAPKWLAGKNKEDFLIV